MGKIVWPGILTSISLTALVLLFAFDKGADEPAAGAGTGEGSEVAVSAATVTPTVTPVLGPPAIWIPLQEGWNYYCYRGFEKAVEAVANDIDGQVQTMFRIGLRGTIERWIRDAPEASIIESVNPNDALFVLMAEEGGWGQIMAAPHLTSVTLVAGWNAVCHTGPALGLEDATAGIAGDIGIAYQLAPEQTWLRFVPNRPEVSNLQTLDEWSPLLILVTSEGGARWELIR